MEKELLAIITKLGIDLDGDIVYISNGINKPKRVYVNVMRGVIKDVTCDVCINENGYDWEPGRFNQMIGS